MPVSASGAAAVLLTILRLIQGVGVGGEWGGSVLLSMEWARTNAHRGFIAAWPQFDSEAWSSWFTHLEPLESGTDDGKANQMHHARFQNVQKSYSQAQHAMFQQVIPNTYFSRYSACKEQHPYKDSSHCNKKDCQSYSQVMHKLENINAPTEGSNGNPHLDRAAVANLEEIGQLSPRIIHQLLRK
jgi:hypothetical protein